MRLEVERRGDRLPGRLSSLGFWAALWLLFVMLLGLSSMLAAFWGSWDAMAIDRRCFGNCAPLEYGYWLGTDNFGRSLGLQLWFGSQTALLGGLAAAIGSALPGIFLGALASWLTFRQKQLSSSSLLWLLVLAGISAWTWIYRALLPGYAFLLVLFLWCLCLLFLLRHQLFSGLAIASKPKKPSGIDLESLLLWLAALTSSLPALLLLMALSSLAIFQGYISLIFVFVFVRWPRFAVLAMQETKHLLRQPFVEAAHFGAVPMGRLWWRHLMPNALAAFVLELTFSMGAFILVEGTFAYLDLGLPEDQASWGRVIAQARMAPDAWWLWVFPGAMLTLSILSLQLLGQHLADVLSGKQKLFGEGMTGKVRAMNSNA